MSDKYGLEASFQFSSSSDSMDMMSTVRSQLEGIEQAAQKAARSVRSSGLAQNLEAVGRAGKSDIGRAAGQFNSMGDSAVDTRKRLQTLKAEFRALRAESRNINLGGLNDRKQFKRAEQDIESYIQSLKQLEHQIEGNTATEREFIATLKSARSGSHTKVEVAGEQRKASRAARKTGIYESVARVGERVMENMTEPMAEARELGVLLGNIQKLGEGIEESKGGINKVQSSILAFSAKYAMAADQIAETYEAFASAGKSFKDLDSLDKETEQILLNANALQVTNKAATDLDLSLNRIYGESAKRYGGIVELNKKFGSAMGVLADRLENVSISASSMMPIVNELMAGIGDKKNFDPQHILAFSAVLDNAKVGAAESAAFINRLSGTMASKTAAFAQATNTSASGFQKLLNTDKLSVIQKVVEGYKKLEGDEIKQSQYFSKLGIVQSGDRAIIQKLAASIGVLNQAVTLSNKGFQEGSFIAWEFGRAQRTPAFQMEKFTKITQAFKLEMGLALNQALVPFITVLNGFLISVMQVVHKYPQVTNVILVSIAAFSALAVAIGTVGAAIWGFEEASATTKVAVAALERAIIPLTGFYEASMAAFAAGNPLIVVINAMRTAAMGSIASMGGLAAAIQSVAISGLAFLMSPLGLAIAGIAALYVVLEAATPQISVLGMVLGAVTAPFGFLYGLVKGIAEGIMSQLTPAAQKLGQVFPKLSKVVDGFKDALQYVTLSFKYFSKSGEDLGKNLGQGIGKGIELIVAPFAWAFSTIKGLWDNTIGWIADRLFDFESSLGGIGAGMISALAENSPGPTFQIREKWGYTIDFLTGLMHSIVSVAMWAGSAIGQAFQGGASIAHQVFNQLQKAAVAAPGAITQAFAGVGGQIRTSFGSAKTMATGVFKDFQATLRSKGGGQKALDTETEGGTGTSLTAIAPLQKALSSLSAKVGATVATVQKSLTADDGVKKAMSLGGDFSYAKSDDQVNELLAKKISYIDFKELQNPQTQNPDAQNAQKFLADHSLKLEQAIDDATTGFAALGLASTKGGAGKLVIRGTNDLPDLVSDVGGEVGADQFAANKGQILSFLSRQSAETGQTAEVIGHSLGGALAQETAANFAPLISKVTTFNSPGISEETANQFKAAAQELGKVAPQVEHFVTKGDFVSTGGQQFLPGQANVADLGREFNVMNPLALHMGTVLDDPQKNKVRELAVEDLNSGLFRAGLLSRSLSGQLLAVSAAVIGFAKDPAAAFQHLGAILMSLPGLVMQFAGSLKTLNVGSLLGTAGQQLSDFFLGAPAMAAEMPGGATQSMAPQPPAIDPALSAKMPSVSSYFFPTETPQPAIDPGWTETAKGEISQVQSAISNLDKEIADSRAWKAFTESFQGAINLVGNILKPLDAVRRAVADNLNVANALLLLVSTFPLALLGPGVVVKPITKALLLALPAIFSAVIATGVPKFLEGQLAASIGGGIQWGLQQADKELPQWARTFLEGLPERFGKAFDAASKTVEGIANLPGLKWLAGAAVTRSFMNALGALNDWVLPIDKTVEGGEQLHGITGLLQLGWGKVAASAKQFMTQLEPLTTALKPLFGPHLDKARTAFSDMTTSLRTQGPLLANNFRTFLQNIGPQIGTFAKTWGSLFLEALLPGAPMLLGALQGRFQSAKARFTTEGMKDLAGGAARGVVGSAEGLAEKGLLAAGGGGAALEKFTAGAKTNIDRFTPHIDVNTSQALPLLQNIGRGIWTLVKEGAIGGGKLAGKAGRGLAALPGMIGESNKNNPQLTAFDALFKEQLKATRRRKISQRINIAENAPELKEGDVNALLKLRAPLFFLRPSIELIGAFAAGLVGLNFALKLVFPNFDLLNYATETLGESLQFAIGLFQGGVQTVKDWKKATDEASGGKFAKGLDFIAHTIFDVQYAYHGLLQVLGESQDIPQWAITFVRVAQGIPVLFMQASDAVQATYEWLDKIFGIATVFDPIVAALGGVIGAVLKLAPLLASMWLAFNIFTQGSLMGGVTKSLGQVLGVGKMIGGVFGMAGKAIGGAAVKLGKFTVDRAKERLLGKGPVVAEERKPSGPTYADEMSKSFAAQARKWNGTASAAEVKEAVAGLSADPRIEQLRKMVEAEYQSSLQRRKGEMEGEKFESVFGLFNRKKRFYTDEQKGRIRQDVVGDTDTMQRFAKQLGITGFQPDQLKMLTSDSGLYKYLSGSFQEELKNINARNVNLYADEVDTTNLESTVRQGASLSADTASVHGNVINFPGAGGQVSGATTQAFSQAELLRMGVGGEVSSRFASKEFSQMDFPELVELTNALKTELPGVAKLYRGKDKQDEVISTYADMSKLQGMDLLKALKFGLKLSTDELKGVLKSGVVSGVDKKAAARVTGVQDLGFELPNVTAEQSQSKFQDYMSNILRNKLGQTEAPKMPSGLSQETIEKISKPENEGLIKQFVELSDEQLRAMYKDKASAFSMLKGFNANADPSASYNDYINQLKKQQTLIATATGYVTAENKQIVQATKELQRPKTVAGALSNMAQMGFKWANEQIGTQKQVRLAREAEAERQKVLAARVKMLGNISGKAGVSQASLPKVKVGDGTIADLEVGDTAENLRTFVASSASGGGDFESLYKGAPPEVQAQKQMETLSRLSRLGQVSIDQLINPLQEFDQVTANAAAQQREAWVDAKLSKSKASPAAKFGELEGLDILPGLSVNAQDVANLKYGRTYAIDEEKLAAIAAELQVTVTELEKAMTVTDMVARGELKLSDTRQGFFSKMTGFVDRLTGSTDRKFGEQIKVGQLALRTRVGGEQVARETQIDTRRRAMQERIAAYDFDPKKFVEENKIQRDPAALMEEIVRHDKGVPNMRGMNADLTKKLAKELGLAENPLSFAKFEQTKIPAEVQQAKMSQLAALRGEAEKAAEATRNPLDNLPPGAVRATNATMMGQQDYTGPFARLPDISDQFSSQSGNLAEPAQQFQAFLQRSRDRIAKPINDVKTFIGTQQTNLERAADQAKKAAALFQGIPGQLEQIKNFPQTFYRDYTEKEMYSLSGLLKRVNISDFSELEKQLHSMNMGKEIYEALVGGPQQKLRRILAEGGINYAEVEKLLQGSEENLRKQLSQIAERTAFSKAGIAPEQIEEAMQSGPIKQGLLETLKPNQMPKYDQHENVVQALKGTTKGIRETLQGSYNPDQIQQLIEGPRRDLEKALSTTLLKDIKANFADATGKSLADFQLEPIIKRALSEGPVRKQLGEELGQQYNLEEDEAKALIQIVRKLGIKREQIQSTVAGLKGKDLALSRMIDPSDLQELANYFGVDTKTLGKSYSTKSVDPMAIAALKQVGSGMKQALGPVGAKAMDLGGQGLSKAAGFAGRQLADLSAQAIGRFAPQMVEQLGTYSKEVGHTAGDMVLKVRKYFPANQWLFDLEKTLRQSGQEAGDYFDSQREAILKAKQAADERRAAFGKQVKAAFDALVKAPTTIAQQIQSAVESAKNSQQPARLKAWFANTFRKVSDAFQAVSSRASAVIQKTVGSTIYGGMQGRFTQMYRQPKAKVEEPLLPTVETATTGSTAASLIVEQPRETVLEKVPPRVEVAPIAPPTPIGETVLEKVKQSLVNLAQIVDTKGAGVADSLEQAAKGIERPTIERSGKFQSKGPLVYDEQGKGRYQGLRSRLGSRKFTEEESTPLKAVIYETFAAKARAASRKVSAYFLESAVRTETAWAESALAIEDRTWVGMVKRAVWTGRNIIQHTNHGAADVTAEAWERTGDVFDEVTMGMVRQAERAGGEISHDMTHAAETLRAAEALHASETAMPHGAHGAHGQQEGHKKRGFLGRAAGVAGGALAGVGAAGFALGDIGSSLESFGVPEEATKVLQTISQGAFLLTSLTALFSPVMAIIAGVALAAGALYIAYKKNFMGIRVQVQRFGKFMHKTWGKISLLFRKDTKEHKKFWTGFRKVTAGSSKALGKIFHVLGGVLGAAFAGIVVASTWFSQKFVQAIEWIAPYAQIAWDQIVVGATWFSENFGKALEWIAPYAQTAWNLLIKLFQLDWLVLSAITGGIVVGIIWFSQKFVQAIQWIAPYAQIAWNMISTVFQVGWQVISTVAAGVIVGVLWFATQFVQALQWIAPYAQGAWNLISAVFQVGWQVISTVVSGIVVAVQWLASTIGTGFSLIMGGAQNIQAFLTDFHPEIPFFGDIASFLLDLPTQFSNAIESIKSLWGNFSGWFTDKFQPIKGLINAVSGGGAKPDTAPQPVVEGAATAADPIASAGSAVASAWAAANQQIMGGWTGLTTLAPQVGTQLVDALNHGAADVTAAAWSNSVVSVAESMDGMATAAQGTSGQIQTALSAALTPGDILNVLKEQIMQLLTTLMNALGSLKLPGLEGAFESVKKFLSSLGQSKTAIEELKPVTLDYAKTIMDAMKLARQANDQTAVKALQDSIVNNELGMLNPQQIADLQTSDVTGKYVQKAASNEYQSAQFNEQIEALKKAQLAAVNTVGDAIDSQASAVVDEFRSRWGALVQTSGKDVGMLFRPGIEMMKAGFSDLYNSTGVFVKRAGKALLTLNFGELKASVDDFGKSFGMAMGSFISGLQSMKLSAIVFGIYSLASLSPLLVLIGAIALATMIVFKNFLGLRTMIVGVAQVLSGILQIVYAFAKGVVIIMDGLSMTIAGVIRAMHGDFELLGAGIRRMWEGVKVAGEGIWHGIQTIALGVWNILKGVLEGIQQIFQATIGRIIGDVDLLVNGFKMASNVITFLGGVLYDALVRPEYLWQRFTNGVATGKQKVEDTFNGIVNKVSELGNAILDLALHPKKAFDQIKEQIDKLFGKIEDLVKRAKALPGEMAQSFVETVLPTRKKKVPVTEAEATVVAAGGAATEPVPAAAVKTGEVGGGLFRRKREKKAEGKGWFGGLFGGKKEAQPEVSPAAENMANFATAFQQTFTEPEPIVEATPSLALSPEHSPVEVKQLALPAASAPVIAATPSLTLSPDQPPVEVKQLAPSAASAPVIAATPSLTLSPDQPPVEVKQVAPALRPPPPAPAKKKGGMFSQALQARATQQGADAKGLKEAAKAGAALDQSFGKASAASGKLLNSLDMLVPGISTPVYLAQSLSDGFKAFGDLVPAVKDVVTQFVPTLTTLGATTEATAVAQTAANATVETSAIIEAGAVTTANAEIAASEVVTAEIVTTANAVMAESELARGAAADVAAIATTVGAAESSVATVGAAGIIGAANTFLMGIFTGLTGFATTAWTVITAGAATAATGMGFGAGIIGAAGGLMGGIFGAIGAAASFAWTAILAPILPIIIAVGAVVAVVGGLYYAFKNNFMGIGDSFKGLMSSFSGLGKALSPLWDLVKGGLGVALGVALFPIVLTLKIVIGLISAVVSGISLFVGAIVGAGSAIVQFLMAPFQMVGNLVGSIFNWIGSMISSSPLLGPLLSALGNALGFGGGGGGATPGAGGPAVQSFAGGGLVQGVGTSTGDRVMANVSPGEFVVNAAATRTNYGLIDAVNNGEDVAGALQTTPFAPTPIFMPPPAVSGETGGAAPGVGGDVHFHIDMNFGDIVLSGASGAEAAEEFLDAIEPQLQRKLRDLLRDMVEKQR